MDIRQCEDFLLVADLGSYAQAAAKLGLSVQTLNARIHSFEKSLGSVLFENVHSRPVLTKEGRNFYQNASSLVRSYRHMAEETKFISQSVISTLRIAVTGLWMPLHLGPFLDEITSRFPKIQLEITDGACDTIASALNAGRSDLYFSVTTDNFFFPGIIRKTLTAFNPCVLLPLSHPLAGRLEISLRELDGETFLPYPGLEDNDIRRFQDESLRLSGIHFHYYESNTSPLFYPLLVPIGKGLLLFPMEFANIPPNTVAIPLADPIKKAVGSYYYRKDAGSDVLSFVREFEEFVSSSAYPKLPEKGMKNDNRISL
ncbi:MAG TPA: LysR family transcriptional regulator [Lachnospiraceae bacterium]|nr:LysR family transcriptional regulator [Lachnospiraceae bacterium]